MPLEEMVFGEEISRQEDEASGWIVAHSWKKQRQDFTPGDSPGPSAGHRAARPAHPKGPINKLIAASRLPRLPKDHYRVARQLPEQATATIQQLERENATLRSELQEIKALVEEFRQRERTPEGAVKVQQAKAQPRGVQGNRKQVGRALVFFLRGLFLRYMKVES
ncbi:hypothetical protein MRX96_054659 [Rhipicephalus microplus]